MRSLDARLFRDVNRFAAHTGWLHEFMKLYAVYIGLALLAACVAGAWLRGRRGTNPPSAVASAAWAPVAAVVAVGVNQPISHAAARARPCHALANVHPLVTCAHDYSFTSDHATAAGGVIVGLLFSDLGMGLLALAVGLILALARVYAGVHYPGDVIAGLLLGGAVAAALRPLGMPVLRWLAVRVERSPLHLLVAAPVPDPERVAVARPRPPAESAASG
ncbi:MAG TPA: phosphatase PAP2 family protein [Acidimicrobiales bacterium]|nr:phosphatase PAP2 family protein [Acidimicrobiales bacterium]